MTTMMKPCIAFSVAVLLLSAPSSMLQGPSWALHVCHVHLQSLSFALPPMRAVVARQTFCCKEAAVQR